MGDRDNRERVRDDGLTWRAVFRDVTHPEAFLRLADVRLILERLCPDDRAARAPRALASVEAAVAWAGDEARVFRDLAGAALAAGADDLLARALLVQSAPLASALGCWNQGASAPGVFEDEVQLAVLALLSADVGVGRPWSSRYDEFVALARRHGLARLAVRPGELPGVPAVGDPLFSLPAALYAVSRRSDAFAPEIAGIDLVLRSIGCLPWWSALRRPTDTGIDWDRLDLAVGATGAGGAPLVASRYVAQRYAALGDGPARRVGWGAAWMAAALPCWSALLADACRGAVDPRRAMADLVRARSPEGAVYHQSFSLAGRELSAWLREAADDPAPLLAALAASTLVRPGDAAHSPLVNGLVGPRGPMFRAFSAEDVAVIRRWIDSLPARNDGGGNGGRGDGDSDGGDDSGGGVDGGGGAVPTGRGMPPPRRARPPSESGPDPEEGVEPANIREAYHVLQGRALPPRTRGFAVTYVRRWLARAVRSLDRSARSLPGRWPTEGLRPWLLGQHLRQAADFDAADRATMPTRDEVVRSTLALAPMTLIDGAWLQGFTELSLASSPIGSPLFETYWDELGNGEVALNHPTIYRAVLRGMGIELPPTASREFAYDGRFDDDAFRRPVYWLCLGKLPLTFLPEILGMNLAMELSGVGGGYRTAHRFLEHHGFSTRFVDIHNTIDNVSTGHSAWAADAIDTYLRQSGAASGVARDEAWHRVRVGYESLDPLPTGWGRFAGRRLTLPRRRPAPVAPAPESLLHHMPVTLES
jgi:hypothetical protein